MTAVQLGPQSVIIQIDAVRIRRLRCRHCAVHVEALPWPDPWARVTRSLAGAVATLAREMSGQQTARFHGLDWMTVGGLGRRAVDYGLAERRHKPLHWIGIDEVSRRKGHRYLTVVYDLERRELVWVGEDRDAETLAKFFTALGPRRCRTIRAVCLDMWASYAKAVTAHLPQGQLLFDRFHIVQHLNHAVDEVRRNEMRRLSRRERAPFRRLRYLLLKSPTRLSLSEKDRISRLVRWNNPVVRAYCLQELIQLFWEYRDPVLARTHLAHWIRKAKRTRLKPIQQFVQLLEGHREGIVAWTRLRLSNGAPEGMNNKIKLVSHRGYGFRSSPHFITAIYPSSAKLPLPAWR